MLVNGVSAYFPDESHRSVCLELGEEDQVRMKLEFIVFVSGTGFG